MLGYLYLLSNPAMPGLIKIGHTTTSVEKRIAQLNSTGVAAAFEVLACFRLPNAAAAESEAHEVLKEFRYARNREFFVIDLATALERLIPGIRESLSSATDNLASSAARGHDLDEQAVGLLQSLAGPGRDGGFDEWDLVKEAPDGELQAEVLLCSLEARKLAKSRQITGSYPHTKWFITTKGKKFLSDHGLVEEWMNPKSIWQWR